MKYKTIGTFKNVQNAPYCKAASDMKVDMGIILDRVTKAATLPASEDDVEKVVYIVTNINGKPELHNNPETYIINKGEYIRADNLRTINGLEIEFAVSEINGDTTGLAAEDLLVFGTDGKIVKTASADGCAVCFKAICRISYMDDGILVEIIAQ